MRKPTKEIKSLWITASQKNLDYLKLWGEQNSKIKSLTKELDETINEAVAEMEKKDKNKSQLKRQLTQALSQLTTLTTELRQTKSDLELHQRVAEFRVHNPFKNHSNFWEDYEMIILLLGTYLLSTWLLKRNIRNEK